MADKNTDQRKAMTRLIQNAINGVDAIDDETRRMPFAILKIGDDIATGRMKGQIIYGPIRPPKNATDALKLKNLGRYAGHELTDGSEMT